jgi:electron transport complex protein RnfB
VSSILIAVFALVLIALAFGAVLGFASVRFRVEGDPIVDRIDALLPQTQCGQCGHPGCRPYAEAVAAGEAHNKCVPGGEETVVKLSELLGRDVLPLDADEANAVPVKKVAVIREAECIGCTKCIQACPVDAILGAAQKMHTVIASECTGCDLCVEPCPVDCIDMVPVPVTVQTWTWEKPAGTGEAPVRRIPVVNEAA